MCDGLVGGPERAVSLVALAYELEEQVRVLLLDGEVAELIDDKQLLLASLRARGYVSPRSDYDENRRCFGVDTSPRLIRRQRVGARGTASQERRAGNER